MKKNRHPELHEITARCACGKTFATISTKPELHVAICSNCHPLYTGEQKVLDTAGRIEKFNKRFKKGAKAA
jgi:large subunit ribosomal protein L31